MTQLKVGDVLSQALVELRRNSRNLLWALSVPAVLIASLDVLGWQQEQSFSRFVLFGLPQMFLSALFAVSCHRIILLGPDHLPNPLGVYATAEVWRFAGAALVLFLLTMLAFFLLLPFLTPLMMAIDGPAAFWLVWGVLIGAGLVLLAAVSRVILLFPALAVGSGQTLSDILDLTESCWPRIALILGISIVLTTLVSMPLVWMAESSTSFWQRLVPTFISYLIGAYGVAVLSCTYRVRMLEAGPSNRPELHEPG